MRNTIRSYDECQSNCASWIILGSIVSILAIIITYNSWGALWSHLGYLAAINTRAPDPSLIEVLAKAYDALMECAEQFEACEIWPQASDARKALALLKPYLGEQR